MTQASDCPPATIKLLLRNHQSPGDILMLTSVVRDLHRAFPGRFLTAIDTSCLELWEHNPFIVSRDQLGKPDKIIDCEYPLIHESNRRPYHFIHGFTQDLERKLGLSIPVTDHCGDIYLSIEERTTLPHGVASLGGYWVIVAGGKIDFTAKWWIPRHYQSVVDHFVDRIRFVQCGATGDVHPPLRNVHNLVGQTSLREFVRIVFHSDGVLCPVTFAMHLAAAAPPKPPYKRKRPCVVIAGGREPPHWEQYAGHQLIHTIGALDCCGFGGCWKSRVQPLADGSAHDQNLCSQPVRVSESLHVARCMTLITPERVIQAMELYESPTREAFLPMAFGSPEKTETNCTIKIQPRALAVTIGVGCFAKLAHAAARELQAQTGMETLILGDDVFRASGLENPSFLKFRLGTLVDAENILYFDADLVCLERWDPRKYFGRPGIVAVRDRRIEAVLADCTRWEIPPEGYFNAGLFMLNPKREQHWMAHAEANRFLHPTGMSDQSPLNAARCRFNVPLTFLDRRFNWIGFGASSLSTDCKVFMAHKLAPDRMDVNLSYLNGSYQLPAPTIEFDELEGTRLTGRSFDWVENERIRKRIYMRGDGTIHSGDVSEPPDYWFVHEVDQRPTLSLASETQISRQFIETFHGNWIALTKDVLLREARDAEEPLTEFNARRIANTFLKQVPVHRANQFAGRGVVICGGGRRYLPSAWVGIHMLRELGCTLPIELWHLSAGEVPLVVRAVLGELDVRCVNASDIRRAVPVPYLGGYELKPYALLNSRFEQVLFLDADNMPVADPTFLFDRPEFSETGAVFWPDYQMLGPDRAIWRICEVAYREEPEFETGQILVDKRRCWKALHLTMHLNENSAFYYQHVHGDKETFHMSWRMLDQHYTMIPHPIHSIPATMCQHDFDGNRLFQHRNCAKWSLTEYNRRIDGFDLEERCLSHLQALAHIWRPVPLRSS